MVNRRRTGRGDQAEGALVRLLRFGIIPAVVIILIIVIVQLDKGKETGGDDSYLDVQYADKGKLETTEGTGENAESGERGDPGETGEDGGEALPAGGDPDAAGDGRADGDGQGDGDDSEAGEAAAAADPSQFPLQQDVMLELTGLVQSYCQAKEECDPELLAWVFGIDDWSEEEKEDERARMELVKASVKGYENISCYSIQGPEQDSYVIFPYYEIRYRETETLMPAFSWGYAKKDESGRYYMVQEADPSVNDYIRKVGEKAEVKAVKAQIQERQQEAIAADQVLEKIYGSTGASEVIIGGVGG